MLLLDVRACVGFGFAFGSVCRALIGISLHMLLSADNLIVVKVELVVQFVELHALEVHLVAKQT